MFQSFFHPFAAIKMLFKDRQLFRLALIPWLINFGVFFIAIFAFIWLDKQLMAKLASWLGTGWWVPVAAWLLGIILLLLVGTGLILSFAFLANLIGGVFFESLSRRAEVVLTGVDRPSPEGAFLKIAMRSLIEELKGIAFFAGVWLAMLLLYFIPGIGAAIFVIVSAIWSTMGLTYEFASPTMERWGMPFRERRRMVFSKPFHSVAFGGAVLALTFIPFVNLFFLPFAVIGGTRWAIDRQDAKSSSGEGLRKPAP
jgi:CysZ protein